MTGLGVVFDGHVLDSTELAEVRDQVLLGGVVRQTADEQFAGGTAVQRERERGRRAGRG